MSGPATPLAPHSARASQPPTGAATPAQTMHPSLPSVPAMPPPADFDFLPDLHRLLTRLTAPPSLPAATPSQQTSDRDGPIEIQQLTAEANAIRRKILLARDKVMPLPDMDRTIEDQEEEIQYLEARIARLKSALQALGHAHAEDTSMTG
ncbi:uncharacterized protein EI97DRAFT_440788 [Westerdykella ornata]|uniref:Mediator of RNA polymerase II transcription subunit 9 n=1 Tax=Westerdykella ornata TaxID=318751 RepID=A0A6A6JNR8_WESOR|nr:uncharacterized protein EI97DRAFT_440788 [Westerdykella ornata]KAF2278290.1 hypothetical protein EI97DRAFT_440788 [Westerdykella ornata]